VADAVHEWLLYGLSGRGQATVEKCTILVGPHIIPALGARKLRDLSADDVAARPIGSGPDRPLRVMFRAALRAHAVGLERLDPPVVCLDIGGVYVLAADAA
jgi:hypothetical protein